LGDKLSGREAFVANTADHLHSAAIHLLRRLRRTDAALEVSGPKLSALSVLVFGGPCTMTMLAEAEHVRLPTMSRLVAELESEGLVTRRSDPHDGRAFLLAPTPKGKRILERGRILRVTQLAERLESLADEDLFLLRKALEVLARVLGERPPEP